MNAIKALSFILYVKDQETSKVFYERLLRMAPVLHVPGMTEFELAPNCKLGLMPEQGIVRLLGDALPDPARAQGIPRNELYLLVENVNEAFAHARACGAKVISAPLLRNWGEVVAYLSDPDGHVIAFAQKANRLA